MSKKFELETSGYIFTKKALKLYKTRFIYRRENAYLGEQLLAGAINTGIAVQSFLQSGERQQKIDCAYKAVEYIDRTVYIVSIMEANKTYKAAKTKDINRFAANLKQALIKEATRLSTPVVITKPAAPAEVIVPEPVVVKKYADPVILHDEDGFDDDFED